MTAVEPFDSSSALEARDSDQNYYIKVPSDAKTVEVITGDKTIFNITKLSPILEGTTADNQKRMFIVGSKVNAKVPALRGGIKGIFSSKCSTTPMTGSAFTIAAGTIGFTAASGHIGGDSYSLYYTNTSGGI